MKNQYPIIFKAFPLPGLLLLPDASPFTIADVNTAYLKVSGKKETDLNEFSGTGMALVVTRKIVENMGGKIWRESEEGKGSIFYFTLLKQ